MDSIRACTGVGSHLDLVENYLSSVSDTQLTRYRKSDEVDSSVNEIIGLSLLVYSTIQADTHSDSRRVVSVICMQA